MLNVIKHTLSYVFIAILMLLSGCAATSPNVPNDGAPKFKFENPDLYAVDSKNYLTYRIESSIYRPPSAMVNGNAVAVNEPRVEILTSDVWRVTHVCKDGYYIFSDEYQVRQEQLIKKSYYLYHLLINKAGKVAGWVYFLNEKKVLLRSERGVVFDPNYWRNPEWDKQPSFKVIKE